ncbi:MAG: YitT family protein [Bacillales bacterium]|jgi:uncharacterized membrane-anchored protein YitT (DUF2179 family)|nr:YitT family protein [Bacillales bacterium]
MIFENSKKLAAVVIGSAIYAIAMNFFMIPAEVLASGFAGVGQIVYKLTLISPGTVILILNIPVLIISWFKVGKSFTLYSFLSVILLTFFLKVIPVQSFSDDLLLNAIYGGVIGGIGVGITFKFGSSLGGMDIVTQIISIITGKSVGILFMVMNGIIILSAGRFFSEEKALYTLICIFVSSIVIDYIHTGHEKLTLTVVTTKGYEITEAIKSSMVRGVTIIPAVGGYTKQPKDVLMIVITRYELYDLKKLIEKIDPKTFINITVTTEVLGYFRKNGKDK